MTPDLIAQCLCALITVLAVRHWRHVLQFLADCENGNIERLEREEARVEEARAVLARFGDMRWV